MKIKTSNNNIKFNKNVINVIDQMNNMMVFLFNLKLIYYYKEIRPQLVDGYQVIAWNGHKSSRLNCGYSFTTLNQYEYILNTGAFDCILFDGSIIRSSFKFDNNYLVSHNHLWWPSPYSYENDIFGDFTPQDKYEDFLSDPNWKTKVRMRSPIRIDFDPNKEAVTHPMVHLHTENYETRINIGEPICFNKFIKYIFLNFYPDIQIDFTKWNFLKFKYQKPKITKYKYSSIII